MDKADRLIEQVVQGRSPMDVTRSASKPLGEVGPDKFTITMRADITVKNPGGSSEYNKAKLKKALAAFLQDMAFYNIDEDWNMVAEQLGYDADFFNDIEFEYKAKTS
jgi:hypothetical protein